jgi:hypothetical protein
MLLDAKKYHQNEEWTSHPHKKQFEVLLPMSRHCHQRTNEHFPVFILNMNNSTRL